MGSLMALKTFKAPLVAANAAAIRKALGHFDGPLGIADQLPAHRDEIDSSDRRKLHFDEIGRRQAADAANRQPGAAAHRVAIPEKAALTLKIGMIGRGNGIAQRAVVGPVSYTHLTLPTIA